MMPFVLGIDVSGDDRAAVGRVKVVVLRERGHRPPVLRLVAGREMIERMR